MQLRRPLDKELRLHAALSTYLLFASIPSAVLVFGIGLSPRGSFSLGDICLFAALDALALGSAASFRLTLTADRLEYRNLFGSKAIQLHDIEKARFGTGIEKYSDRLLPPIRLEILPRESTAKKVFYVNLKVFKLDELRNLFAYLPVEDLE